VSTDPTAARAAHIVHERATEPALILELLSAATARLDRTAPGPQLLVVVPDADAALSVARLAAELDSARGLLPVTSVRRATRLLPAGPVALVGALNDLVELQRRAVLKLDAVAQVLVLDTERMDDPADLALLDTLLAELPADASRVVVASPVSEPLRDMMTRHLHKARRMSAPVPTAAALPSLEVMVSGHASRPSALAQLLDDADPPSMVVVAERAADRAAAEQLLGTLGLGAPMAQVVGAGTVPGHAALVVLWGVPSSRVLSAVASAQPARVVAMVGARERRALAAVAAGAVLTPVVAGDAGRQVRASDARVRGMLRDELAKGLPLRELAALEPLFEQHDPADVAAVAVRLLDRVQARLTSVMAAPPVVVAAPAAAPAAESRPDRFSDARPTRSGSGGPRRDDRRDTRSGPREERRDSRGPRDSARGPSRDGARGPSRDSARGPRDSARGPSRDGPGGERRGPPKGGPRGDSRGPRDGPKGFGKGRPPRGPEEGGSKRDWQDRGEKLRNATRRRDP
jgi:hypothetical protein